jgi:RND family efflux transporter MFP subunit
VSANPELREGWGRSDPADAQRTELDQVWRQFGAAATPEEFCRSWLALQCRIIADVNDGVVVLQQPGSESFAPLAFWPDGQRDRSHLAEVTERALRDGRGVVQPRDDDTSSAVPARPDYQLAYPIRLDNRVRGVVGLDIAWREEGQLQNAMRQLQWGAGWLEVFLRRHADPGEAAQRRVKLILQLVSGFLEREAFNESASAVTTEIASQLGCDRVVLALLAGKELKIEAVSHTVQFDRHANLLNATVAAMNEALDQREPIVYPPDRDDRLVVTFSHAELAQMSGAGGIVTLPLYHGERQIGALTLERAPGFRFETPSVELLEGLAAVLGPLVDLKRAQQRSLPSHAKQSVKGFWGKLTGPRHAGFKFGMILLVAVTLFFIFATGPFRISANARVEGEIQRAVTAPFQSYVRETSKRAGDTVSKGELLARLDDRDLSLERVRLKAQREQLGKQYREAMAKRDRASVRSLNSQIDQANAQLALIEEQLARTELVAPFDGILVSGDLTQALGAPLERGQVLFEIAPLDKYRVVLQVDERDITAIRVGQLGDLVLSAMPQTVIPILVQKTTPVSMAKEGRNTFRVEAQISSDAGTRLRPGMEGIVKIHVDDRRLSWIWTRELVNWIELKLWAWTP